MTEETLKNYDWACRNLINEFTKILYPEDDRESEIHWQEIDMHPMFNIDFGGYVFNILDMYTALYYNMKRETITSRYEYCLDCYYDDSLDKINLYNFWKKYEM